MVFKDGDVDQFEAREVPLTIPDSLLQFYPETSGRREAGIRVNGWLGIFLTQKRSLLESGPGLGKTFLVLSRETSEPAAVNSRRIRQ